MKIIKTYTLPLALFVLAFIGCSGDDGGDDSPSSSSVISSSSLNELSSSSIEPSSSSISSSSEKPESSSSEDLYSSSSEAASSSSIEPSSSSMSSSSEKPESSSSEDSYSSSSETVSSSSIEPSSSSIACTAGDNDDTNYCSGGTMKEYGIMTDAGGRTYKTVVIGEQTWMAENLNYEVGNNWCYEQEDYNCGTYGRIYEWDAAIIACPDGWHLPDYNEWNDLIWYVGDEEVAGRKLKSAESFDGTDDYGFSALPGGSRNSDGTFNEARMGTGWWTSTKDNNNFVYAMEVAAFSEYISRESYQGTKFDGFYVRCVKN